MWYITECMFHMHYVEFNNPYKEYARVIFGKTYKQKGRINRYWISWLMEVPNFMVVLLKGRTKHYGYPN